MERKNNKLNLSYKIIMRNIIPLKIKFILNKIIKPWMNLYSLKKINYSFP